jgi:hypothetical protein
MPALMSAPTLLPGVAPAADKIYLTCSGTVSLVGHSEKSLVGNISVVIDLDRGIVTMPVGDSPITKVTEDYIEFRADTGDSQRQGRIDRISGSVVERITHNVTANNIQIVDFVDLTCKPAKALS